MKSERKDDAVSPVIGVMLMLVVTLIIAAVVSVFASGLATDTTSTPISAISLEGYVSSEPYGTENYIDVEKTVSKHEITLYRRGKRKRCKNLFEQLIYEENYNG